MRYFKKVIEIIINLMIPLIILALMIGISIAFLDLKMIFNSPIEVGFNKLVANILSMFVVIELLRGLIEYFEVQRLRLTLIADAALVFIMREAMIGVYQRYLQFTEIISLAVLLLVIGGIRTLAITYSPGKVKESRKDE
jgi:uncharacterized membrane protein (DUF373 family)